MSGPTKIFTALLALAAFAAPLPAFAAAGPQILVGRSTNAAVPTTTRWLQLNQVAPSGGSTLATSSGAISPIAGTFSNLYAYAEYPPGGSTSWVVTVEIGGVLKTVTCTITSAITSCNDLFANTGHSDVISATQTINIKFAATGGTPTAAQLFFSIQFTPTVAGQTFWNYVGGNTLSTTAENYMPLFGGNAVSASETAQTTILPEGGTFQNFYHSIGASASPGTYTLSIRNFTANATTSITCVISALLCQDTADTYATSSPASGVIGDRLDLAFQPASSPTARSQGGGAIGFTPTTAGNFEFNSFFGSDASVALRYIPIVGAPTGSSPLGTEASTTVYADAMTITDLQVYLNTPVNTGAGIQKQFAIRVNSATSTATCTVNQTGTKDRCRWSGTLAVNAGDLITVADGPTGAPGGSTGNISIIANANTAGAVVTTPAQHQIMGGFIRIIGGLVRIF